MFINKINVYINVDIVYFPQHIYEYNIGCEHRFSSNFFFCFLPNECQA